MRRTCGWCRKSLGHKCSDCGAAAEPVSVAAVAGTWRCSNDACAKVFSDVGAPVTTGICDECMAAQRGAKAMEAAA